MNSVKHHVLAIIPARSGSKTIPHKNIREINGRPMLAYSIDHALKSKRITRTIVSTDSHKYAEIARQHGAETPFLRPAEISQDFSTDLEVFEHALRWLQENENYTPAICVHLRPTHPVRDPAQIDEMIQILIDNDHIDSVRSVVLSPETPYKMWFRRDDGLLYPVIQTDIHEAYNMPRQALPQTFLQNASVDVVRSEVVTGKHSMTGERIFGYVMESCFDIDTPDQLEKTKVHMGNQLRH